MSGQCRELGKLEAWSREGSGAPLPEALRRHASACATCGGFLAEVEQLRSAFAELGADPIPDERLGAIRFSVMAGARRSRHDDRLPPRRVDSQKVRPAAWVAAAATLLLLTGGGWALLWGTGSDGSTASKAAVPSLRA